MRAGLPIELDVHLLADRQPVVFHDRTLLRMTGVEGNIEEHDAQSLRALRLLKTDYPIPLLADVLREVDGAVPLLIEIKNAHPIVGELEHAVLRELQNYRGAFAIQSFNALSVHYFRKHAPSICRGQLSVRSLGVPFARLTQPDFVAYYVDCLSDRLTARLRQSGTGVLAWTVTSAAQYERAKAFADNYIFETGVDFIPPALRSQDGEPVASVL